MDLMMQKEMRTMKTVEISKQQVRQKKKKELWQAATMDKYARIKVNLQNLQVTEKVYDSVKLQLKSKFERETERASSEQERAIKEEVERLFKEGVEAERKAKLALLAS